MDTILFLNQSISERTSKLHIYTVMGKFYLVQNKRWKIHGHEKTRIIWSLSLVKVKPKLFPLQLDLYSL